MKSHSLLRLCTPSILVPILVILGTTSHATEFSLANHDITLSIETLQDPSTFGLSMDIDPQHKDNNYPIMVSLESLLSLKRNVGERALLSVSGNRTWRLSGEWIEAPSDLHSQRRTYAGRVGIETGLESGPRMNEDGAPGSWRLANLTVGVIAEQHIPWTRVQFPWNKYTESSPLALGASGKYVVGVDEEPDMWRGSGSADWDIAVYARVPHWSLFLGGRGEWHFLEGGTQKYSVEGRAQIYISAIQNWVAKFTSYNIGDPVVFANYLSGSKPPDFERRNEWTFGLGTTWSL